MLSSVSLNERVSLACGDLSGNTQNFVPKVFKIGSDMANPHSGVDRLRQPRTKVYWPFGQRPERISALTCKPASKHKDIDVYGADANVMFCLALVKSSKSQYREHFVTDFIEHPPSLFGITLTFKCMLCLLQCCHADDLEHAALTENQHYLPCSVQPQELSQDQKSKPGPWTIAPWKAEGIRRDSDLRSCRAGKTWAPISLPSLEGALSSSESCIAALEE